MKQEAEIAYAALAKTNGVHAAVDEDGCSGCGGVTAEEVDNEEQQSDSDVDVCACCSEWLSKALLCSCQVILKTCLFNYCQGPILSTRDFLP
jgi:hypothetical protein